MGRKKSEIRSLMMVTQLGLGVIVPIFLCILAGFYLDRYAGTRTMFWWILLGFGTGGFNGYKIMKAVLLMNVRDDEADWDTKHRPDTQKSQTGGKNEEAHGEDKEE